MTTHDELVASGLHECASDCPVTQKQPATAAGRALRDALWVYTGNKSAQDAITQRILAIEAEAAAAPAACDLDPDGHCNTHGGKHIEPSAAEPPMRAFWNGDAPRRILVELPPIGKDGRCTGCGKKPSRDTGSCGCHRGVIEHVGRYEPAAAEPPNHEHNFVNPANEIVADNGWLVCTVCGLLQDPAERPEMIAAVQEQVRLLQEGVPNIHERAGQPPPDKDAPLHTDEEYIEYGIQQYRRGRAQAEYEMVHGESPPSTAAPPTYTEVERLDRPGNRADGVRTAQPPPCIFPGCVSTDRHWHGGFPGGYTNPNDPEGPPIEFTTEPAPGVRDYNGARLAGSASLPPSGSVDE